MKISVCTDIVNWGKDFFDGLDELIDSGANAIEFWKWSNKDVDTLKKYVKEEKINIPIFCIDSSDEHISELCLGNILSGGMEAEFIKAVKESVAIAKELSTGFLITTVGDRSEEFTYDEQVNNIKKCISSVVNILKENNITLLLEPISREERPAYLLPEAKDMLEVIKDIDNEHVKLLYDVYHQYNTGDYSVEFITENVDYIGHIHIADVPGRHEPGTGEINFKNLLTKLYELSYNRYIGLEYTPMKKDYAETVTYLKKMIRGGMGNE